jgi:hypothetical protein
MNFLRMAVLVILMMLFGVVARADSATGDVPVSTDVPSVEAAAPVTVVLTDSATDADGIGAWELVFGGLAVVAIVLVLTASGRGQAADQYATRQLQMFAADADRMKFLDKQYEAMNSNLKTMTQVVLASFEIIAKITPITTDDKLAEIGKRIVSDTPGIQPEKVAKES